MEPQRLVEHRIQVRQPRKMILRDHVLAAHLLDLPIETVLPWHARRNLVLTDASSGVYICCRILRDTTNVLLRLLA
jgi:hypothetical protein